METRNILTEHSREVAEPGVQWVQQYSPIISGMELKSVPSKDLSDKVRIFWEGHKIWKNLPLKRSIFQTFWKPDFGARFLFIELDARID